MLMSLFSGSNTLEELTEKESSLRTRVDKVTGSFVPNAADSSPDIEGKNGQALT